MPGTESVPGIFVVFVLGQMFLPALEAVISYPISAGETAANKSHIKTGRY